MATLAPMQSAFRAEEWFPVYDALLQGLVHACNNRVAALAGLVQLHEAGLSTPEEGMAQLGAEVDRLRELMAQYRLLSGTRSARRDPARLGEAVQQAATLLGYHLEARHLRLEIAAENGHVEPVLLFHGDALRFAVMALLAVRSAVGRGAVRAEVARVGGDSALTVTCAGAVKDVRESREYQALVAAVERERGAVTVAATNGGALQLTLALPGLTG